jgi:hypothetical protein
MSCDNGYKRWVKTLVSTIWRRNPCELTPRARIGVVNGRVHIAQVDLAHETVNLSKKKEPIQVPDALIVISKWSYIKLSREGGETRLSIDTWEDMQRKLLGAFDDDLLAIGIPSDHALILWSFEETV